MELKTALKIPERSKIDVLKLLEGYFSIMKLWGLSNKQAQNFLGDPTERTFYNMKSGKVKSLPKDIIERIGWIAGIYKALQITYSDPALADDWLHRENKYFCGQSPLQKMSAGSIVDLAAVRQYLDAARSPW